MKRFFAPLSRVAEWEPPIPRQHLYAIMMLAGFTVAFATVMPSPRELLVNNPIKVSPANLSDEATIPADLAGRKAFIDKYWMVPRKRYDAERFRSRLETVYGKERTSKIHYAEAYELSEYGYQPSPEEVKQLFPFLPG